MLSDARPHQARLGICCPHCDGPARIRTSRSLSPLYRQLNCQCCSPECGHTFGADLTITHTISPSAQPNPAIVLRISPPRRRIAANDDDGPPLSPANDLLES